MKTITYKIAKVMRAIAVSLILLMVLPGISKGGNSANELTIQVKSWINDNAYWSDVDHSDSEDSSATTIQSENQNLSNEMESWMSSGTLWSGDSDEEEQELSLQMKTWIGNTSFWNDATEENNQQLALQLKLWLNNNTHWSVSEEQINHYCALVINQ